MRKNPEAKNTYSINFYGGGDSGAIEDNEFGWNGEDKNITLSDGRTSTISNFIGDFVYEQIQSTGVDWYNNEGGCGECFLELRENPKPLAILSLEVNYYEMELVEQEKIKII